MFYPSPLYRDLYQRRVHLALAKRMHNGNPKRLLRKGRIDPISAISQPVSRQKKIRPLEERLRVALQVELSGEHLIINRQAGDDSAEPGVVAEPFRNVG